MAARIEIVINPKTGTVEFEVSGMPGTGCTDITEALAKAMGGRVLDEQLTQEYYTSQDLPAYTGE